MKKIKTILTLSIIFILVSCENASDTYDWLKRMGVQWSFSEKEEIYTEQGKLKVQSKPVNGAKSVKEFTLYNNSDHNLDNDSKEMIAMFTKGSLWFKGRKITSGIPFDISEEKKLTFNFEPLVKEAGIIRMTFYTLAEQGDIRPSIYDLQLLKNLPPKAELIVRKLEGGLPYEHELDASGTVDNDADMGGAITKFKYKVTEITEKGNKFQDFREEPLKVSTYRFPQPGKFKVELVVVDSDLDEAQITIEVTVK